MAAALALALLVLLPAAGAQLSPDVTAADLRAHVERLASDADAGRATGSPESAAAARELGELFAAAGLRPAGYQGFLQDIGWTGYDFVGAPEVAWIAADGTRTAGAFGGDFEYLGGPPRTGELEVVVVHADSEGPRPPRADAALVLVGGRRVAQKWLSDSGAPGGAGWGVLLIPSQAAYGPSRFGESRGLYRRADGGGASEPLRLLVHGRLRDALLGGQVEHVAVAVGAREPASALNVVALLPGAGTPERPELAQEAVVITAHYDHLGVLLAPEPPPAAAPPASPEAPGEAPPEPDLVFNGADDDASGCAAVLELAAAFGAQAAAGAPPARTLIFLLVTGEELGLLGTEYWLDHPAVPLERIVLNLNFEMIGRPDELAGGEGRLWLTGDERSNLGAAWRATGLPIAPDARPEQHFFERSDNMAFVQRGIVGQTLSSYDLHPQYHTVEDEVGTLDFEHMEAAVRTALRAAQLVADGTIMPAWVEGKPESRTGEGR